MNVGSLFSGDGLLDFGLALAGWEHAFFCESGADRRAILSLRWPGVPIFEDVRDVDGSAPRVDLLAGGFPCRGASTAGLREGLDHPETALWREFARAIGAIRPRLVLLENVANLLAVRDGGAWAEVVGDLAALGYVFAWDCLPAAAFGAPHLRDRVFCVAADASRSDGQGAPSNGAALERAAADAGSPVTNPERNGVRQQPEPQRRGEGPREPAETGADVADSSGERRRGGVKPQPNMERDGLQPAHMGAGSTVEWAEYAPAVARWEEAYGPAPEPLLRGVDARPARKVVRSRLSALGDGVQVQAGCYLGERLMALLGQESVDPVSRAA